MVNGGVLEVGVGGSGFRRGCWGVCDPQGLGVLVNFGGGCISPALYATNRWDWTEGLGEVGHLWASPGFLALGPAGS